MWPGKTSTQKMVSSAALDVRSMARYESQLLSPEEVQELQQANSPRRRAQFLLDQIHQKETARGGGAATQESSSPSASSASPRARRRHGTSRSVLVLGTLVEPEERYQLPSLLSSSHLQRHRPGESANTSSLHSGEALSGASSKAAGTSNILSRNPGSQPVSSALSGPPGPAGRVLDPTFQSTLLPSRQVNFLLSRHLSLSLSHSLCGVPLALCSLLASGVLVDFHSLQQENSRCGVSFSTR